VTDTASGASVKRGASAGRKGKGRPKGEAVPARVLSEATRLFAQQGFQETSVQEIVEAAQVTKGAMYYYYTSKDDLLFEIYARLIRSELESMERVFAMKVSAAETVYWLMTDIMVQSAENRDELTIFLREMHRLSPAKDAEVRADRRRYHVEFRGVIEQGQDSGEFRADVSAEMVTIGFFGLVHHYFTWYKPDDRFDTQEMAHRAAVWLLGSLLNDGVPMPSPLSGQSA
jgi:AcrR family transcriptional regulator